MALTNEQQIILDIQTKVDSAKSLTSLKEIKQAIRDLQGEAITYQDVSEGAFQAAQTAAGLLKDKLKDLQAQTAAVSGEPLENVSSSIDLVKNSLSGLDFGQATTGIRLLATNIKNIKLGDVSTGIKDVASAFLALGKAILTNPIFLLGAAIALIVANFEDLKNIGGIVGKVFTALGNTIEGVIDAVKSIGDAFGITNTKAELLKKTTIELTQAQRDLKKAQDANVISLKKLNSESVVLDEWRLRTTAITDAQTDFNTQLDNTIEKYPELKDILKKSSAEAFALINNLGIKDDEQRKKTIDLTTKFYAAITERDKFYNENKATIEIARRKAEIDAEEKRATAIVNIKQREKALLIIGEKRAKLERDKANNLILTDVANTGDVELKLAQDIIDEKQKLIDESNANIQNAQKSINEEQKKGQIELYQTLTDAQKNFILEEKKKDILRGDGAISRSAYYDKVIRSMYKANQKEEIQAEKVKQSMLFQQIKAAQENKKILYETKKKDLIKLQKDLNKTEVALENKKNRELKAIDLRKNLSDLQDKQTSADELFKQKTKNIDNEYAMGKLSYVKYQEALLDLQLKYQSETERLTTEKYKTEIQLADGNAEKQKQLQVQLDAYLLGQSNVVELTMRQAVEKTQKHFEDIGKEKEAILKEMFDIEISLIKKREEYYNQQLAQDQSELDRLDMNAEKFKIHTGEKLMLIKQVSFDTLNILKAQYDQEIALAESKGEATDAIEAKYAEKRKMTREQEHQQEIAAKMDTADKIIGYTTSAMTAISDMVDIANNIDESKRDKDGKLSLELQKKKFNRNKNLQYANAIMNTAASVTTALVEENYVGAAINAALGAVQIAKIDHTYFKAESSGGSSGGGGGSVAAPSAPSMASAPSAPSYTQGFLNSINPASWVQFNPPTRHRDAQRVYVVESDITRTQGRVEVQTQRSMLGR